MKYRVREGSVIDYARYALSGLVLFAGLFGLYIW